MGKPAKERFGKEGTHFAFVLVSFGSSVSI